MTDWPAFAQRYLDGTLEADIIPEPYCDYCEKEGHLFRSCPARDDAELWDEL